MQDAEKPDVALSAEQARRAQSISRNTMSPFCPGRTLSDCPSGFAAEWREDIRRWTAEGLSAEEIRERLEQRLPEGSELSGAPDSGLGWGLPVGLSVGAVLVVAVILRRLRNRGRETATASRGAALKSGSAGADRDEGPDSLEPSGARSAGPSDDDRSGPRASTRDEELERRLDEELRREE
jgi:cytochrome c-type biogenesis protein CcmH/NrfF